MDLFRTADGALRGWLSPVVLCVVAVFAALGALGGAPVGKRVFEYQWQDARFCDDCHAHDYANEAWERSLHRDLTTCHDCHLVPIRHYPRNLWVMLTDPPKRPEDIPQPHVSVVICEQCHVGRCDPHGLTGPMSEALCNQVAKTDNSPLHRVHLDAARRDPNPLQGGDASEGAASGPIECVDCHGAGDGPPHRFEADPASCVRCHKHFDSELSVAGLTCRQCHGEGFLASPPSDPDNDHYAPEQTE